MNTPQNSIASLVAGRPMTVGTDIPDGAITIHRIKDDDEPERATVIPPLAPVVAIPKKPENKGPIKRRKRSSPVIEKLVEELRKESPQTTARLQKACGMAYSAFACAAARAKKRNLIEFAGKGDTRTYWLYGTRPAVDPDKPTKPDKFMGKNAAEVSDFNLFVTNPLGDVVLTVMPPVRAIATADGGALLIVGNTITHELSPAQRAAIVGLK